MMGDCAARDFRRIVEEVACVKKKKHILNYLTEKT